MTHDDIVVDGVSMAELVSKQFVGQDMHLIDDEEYWEGYNGFNTCLKVEQSAECQSGCCQWRTPDF